MAKRGLEADEDSPHRKRLKITKDGSAREPWAQVQKLSDLQQLLAFEQDAGSRVRQRILSFKGFLDFIAYSKESDERSSKRALLLEYLRAQTSKEKEDSPCRLADIVRTWSFATRMNVDNLYSSTAAVLALLLKTISSFIEFREVGIRLCKSLLEDDQVKLFDKGLSSKVKGYLISPCIRLLTEILSFDGGHSAQTLYRHREITFKNLNDFLSMREVEHKGDGEGRAKPTVRDNALRYLYANLRLQKPVAKLKLVAQDKILRAIFRGSSGDPPGAVLELIDVLKKDIALDDRLSHDAKSRIFNVWVLSHIADLHVYEEADKSPKTPRSVRASAHELLLLLCTSTHHGIFDLQQQGLSETNFPEQATFSDVSRDRLADDKLPRMDQVKGTNERIASFLQTLRPHSNVLDAGLVYAIFCKAPGLVPDYFARRNTFTFEPKATATWIGYSSFLLAVTRLPLPISAMSSKIDRDKPPSVDTVIDHILPLSLDRKVMTRGLNQSTTLLKFLSAKILIAAFEKLAKALALCRPTNASIALKHDPNIWNDFKSDLVATFCDRIPDVTQIIAQFRSCDKSNIFLQESLTRLIALYYTLVPQVALEAKLDISTTLSSMLQEDLQEGVNRLRLGHMLRIAHCSPSIQWWHKSEKMAFSPFTTLLKVQSQCCQSDFKSTILRSLLVSLVKESQLLHCEETMIALDILVLSLEKSEKWCPSHAVFDFVDNCILRFVQKPVHYYDAHSQILMTGSETHDTHGDLLLVTILEQWPFLVSRAHESSVTSVALWLIRYIELCNLRIRHSCVAKCDIGVRKVLVQIRDQLERDVKDEVCRSMVKKSLREPSELGLSIDSIVSVSSDNNGGIVEKARQGEAGQSNSNVDLLPSGPSQEKEDHFGLNQWTRQEIQDAITDGAIEELFLCLCSKYTEIRQQAVDNIVAFLRKLEASGYGEWRQTYLISGELGETAKAFAAETPLPYLVAVLAAQLLAVVADPLHFMYEKANHFLQKGPQWNVRKLPSYWVDKIIMKPPTNDDSHYQEAEWLLDTLIDGLRTSADFELYRGCHIFERLLTFSESPSIPELCLQKLLDLLFRCTYVEGSSTLIAHCGLIRWITSLLTLKPNEVSMTRRLKVLALRLYETSDQQRVDGWSIGTLSREIHNVQLLGNEA